MIKKSARIIGSCKKHGETDFYWKLDKRSANGGYWRCCECHRDACRRSRDGKAMNESKDSTAYLGNIAEISLSKFFDNITRMPTNNPGFDYICGKGYKIDVKCSCLHERPDRNYPNWAFCTEKNVIADYFLCLAFDNRENLNPLHVWLIPSAIVRHIKRVSIANCEKSLKRVGIYERPKDRVLICHDAAKK